MSRYTGHDLALKWTPLGGAAIWLDADYRSMDVKEDVKDADATAGDDTYADHLPTFTDTSGDIEMLDSTGAFGTTQWNALRPRTEGTLIWYPEGTTTTKPMHTVPAYIQSRNRTIPYDNVVTIKLTLQFQSEPVISLVA